VGINFSTVLVKNDKKKIMNLTKENIRKFLGWCSIINIGLLLYWILALVFARDWVFWVHTSAVEISKESFAEINYAMMG
jgi:hypothetical protein